MKITIPESTAEIKLGDYQKYVSVVENSDNDESFQGLKMIELFCHVPFRDVVKMKMTDVSETLEILNKAFEKKRKFKNRFTINEVEFGFIPDLESLSMGEYIDVTQYLGVNEDLHKLMAVLYRPITESTRDLYNIEDYKGSETYSDIMRFAPLDTVLEASVFFYHLTKALIQGMKHSSEPQVMEVMDLVQTKFSQLNGDGTAVSLPLVERVI